MQEYEYHICYEGVKMEDCDLSKKKEMEERGQMVDLPPEIIHDIVSRLPVKALYRFKLVSKQWLSLITDPYFMANYNKAAIENKDAFISRRRLVFTIEFRQGPNRLYSLDLDQFLYENRNVSRHNLVATPTELDFDFVSGKSDPRSSCNGLLLSKVCSKGICSYSLNNPVTKESKKLPKPPTWRPPIVPLRWEWYGLGFDYSMDEYKVINGQIYKDDGLVFSVYTLQTDSWRHINCSYPHFYNHMSGYVEGILVNGALHWLGWKKHPDESPVIISFLLAKEEVREIALPPTNVSSVWARLGAFRNSLCITQQYITDSADEVWVMKDYGVSDSWTIMQISLPYHDLQHSGFWTESHDLMVIDKRFLVMYNFNDDTFWNLSIDFVENHWFRNVGIYLESLLPSLIDQEQNARP